MRTPEADRFRTECEVPDPPLSPKGRQRYWDDTVFEAVAELRKRLRSQDSDEALLALEMIIDLEKTRIRHAAKMSGTHVPVLPDIDDDWGNPLPLASRDRAGAGSDGERRDGSPPLSSGGTGLRAGVLPTTGSEAGATKTQPTGSEAGATRPEPAPARSRLALPVRIPGVTGCFSDRDDDWMREPGARESLDPGVDPVALGFPPLPPLRY